MGNSEARRVRNYPRHYSALRVRPRGLRIQFKRMEYIFIDGIYFTTFYFPNYLQVCRLILEIQSWKYYRFNPGNISNNGSSRLKSLDGAYIYNLWGIKF